MKKIVIGIHGFGVARSNEWLRLKQEFKEKNIDFVCPDLFETTDDFEWETWIYRAQKVVEGYIEKGYIVDLVGFSMGGVISAFLASFLKIDKLILIAPSYYYFNLESILRLVDKIKNLDDDERINYIKDEKLNMDYAKSFTELVKKLKPAISLVENSTLIIAGSNDEIVPIKSFKYAYNTLKSEDKILMILEDGVHELHVDGKLASMVVKLISNYILGLF